MQHLKHWFLLGIRIIVWCHVVFILLTLGFSLLYTILPPGISTLHVYRRWIDGIKPKYPVRFIALEKLNPNLTEMLIAAEDGNFPVHRGIDIESMKQAWQINRQLGYYAAGASTLTQQLARTLFLFPKKWLVRKYAEIWLALGMELVMPKKRIVELYVNVVEWGPGIYGIDAAARHWFKKPATALGVDELARLVAILPNPLDYTPHSFWRHPDLRWRWQYLWQRFGHNQVQNRQPVQPAGQVRPDHAIREPVKQRVVDETRQVKTNLLDTPEGKPPLTNTVATNL